MCVLGHCRVVQFSRVRLFVTPWTTACQASLSITNSQSSPKPMSIESVMPSNHLTLCHPLLLLPSIFPSIRVFSNESALCIRWPKYWSFSFNISPSSEHPGLISFRMDWLDLLAVQGTPESEWWRPQKGECSFWINTVGRSWVGLTVTLLLTLAANAAAWNESYSLVPRGYPPGHRTGCLEWKMQLRLQGKEKQMLCSGQKMFTCWGGGASCYVGVSVGMASLVAQTVENLTAIQETWTLIPGLGRSPGEGNGYPLQCSSLEKSKDRGEAFSLFIHWFIGT